MSKDLKPIIPLAYRPEKAAAVLGISESFLAKLVKEGKIRAPVSVRKGVSLFDADWLRADWEALRDECLNGENEWDAA
jgi:excisionase family DNA binding protein